MKKKGSKNKLTVPAKLLDEKSPFAVRESFNQLRTNLMYISADFDLEVLKRFKYFLIIFFYL